MKTKILKGIVMMSAVVLSACSSTKQIAQQKKDYNDDVYYSKAKAGDQIDYASSNSYRDDGYYDDYAGRINRFGYSSPFAYDSYLYSPYSSLYSPYSYYGMGLGLGLGYGFSSFYSPYSLYSPYSYAAYPYLYSGYGAISNGNYTARPSRGTGNPGAAYNSAYSGTSRGTSAISRSYYPTTRSTGINSSSNGYSQRATRQYVPQTQRSYPTYTAPSSFGGGFSGGGGGHFSGARPGRG